MNFPSIDIQGSILSTDLLAKIRSEQASFQQGKDFYPDYSNANLKDEISLAWQEAKGQWVIYNSKLNRLKDGETGTTETRNFWISPLLTNLGYNLSFNRQSEELQGKSFPIGYRDSNLDGFPVYVGGYHESLDKRPENKQLRVSPHAMLQEYLNYSEHLYGMVTNGRQLRLLRDASRITRLSYVEFNLEKMMEEDLYSDFVILYRVLHASRMPKKMDGGAESIIEKYHQEGLEAGSTIRSKLGNAVKEAIKNLANGFINHPNNTALREAVASGNFSADEYYRHQLRIIYRLLFLFVIEERNLVYADNKTPDAKRFNQIYFNYYSLLRLRKLAKKLLPPEASRHYDLWQGLISTFSLFEKKEIGQKLGIMALQGDLFGYHAISGNGYDLHQCYLSNAVLLNIIKSLSYFENDNGVLIAVNYGGLDVEEFGSVYEGLLELKLEVKKIEGSDQYSCSFDTSNERGKSGSHYTPEELVQPLIKHSLDYLIVDKLKENNPEQALLSLKVADVACGSGHILLSAARRIAHELACLMETRESGSKEKVEQPAPTYVRKAMKDVVRNCIYGVDKNPLAVELCKIALWLEAYNPGEPLNFLDHHIKCGDAIVGLAHRSELENGIANEAFKTLSGDDKVVAKICRDKNVKERKQRAAKALQLKAEFEKSTENSVQEAMAEYKTFSQLPENTPEEIERKAKAYQKFIDGKGFTFLKAMADTQVAQFFIPKTEANKDYLMTDADYRLILSGYKGWQDKKVAKATAIAHEQRFFHWFIEFPEVFSEGGFDCVLGNPPFLGGLRISTNYGQFFLNYINSSFIGSGGTTDLVAYFFRRGFDLLTLEGYLSLIGTNTISQGDTRKATLEYIVERGGEIIFAYPSIKWPGVANLDVTLVAIANIKTKKIDKYLKTKIVKDMGSQLEEGIFEQPKILLTNKSKAFIGSFYLGDGFILSKKEKETIESDGVSHNVIFRFLNGKDVNESFNLSSNRWIINFNSLSESKAREYPNAYQRILETVKPHRDKLLTTSSTNKTRKEKWWQYAALANSLYESIKDNIFVYVTAQTSKFINFTKVTNDFVFAQSLVVFSFKDFVSVVFLQCSFHTEWIVMYGTTLGKTLRYTPTDCFQTYPFKKNLNPQQEQQLESLGEAYHEHRRQLMLGMQLGLTKTYNLFHSNAITAQGVNEKDKQVAALQKHLEKTANTISFNEAIQGILKLRELHVQMDEAVLDAYGWNDIALRHDFYEVDYLPENDRIRFTIHPDARKEVLKRLLELNHKIHAQEVAEGLWKKNTATKNKRKKGGNATEIEEAAEDDEGLFNMEEEV
jgi:hypothetical protein